MKATKIFATAVIALVTVMGVKAQTTTGLTLKTNDELVYRVNDHGTQYDLTVTVVTTGVPVNFMWTANGNKGAVTIDNAGVSDATAIHKTFEPGGVELKGETGIWASKKMYKLLKTNTALDLTFDEGKQSGTLKNATAGNTAVDVNGTQTKFATLSAKTDGDSATGSNITVLDDANNPLIFSIYFNGGFSMTLKSIKQQQE